jgi:hypothetical protein
VVKSCMPGPVENLSTSRPLRSESTARKESFQLEFTPPRGWLNKAGLLLRTQGRLWITFQR